MRFIPYLLLFILLSGCNKLKVHTDTAAQLSGRYDVKVYAINGDTLLGNGRDRFGYDELYIEIGRKSADSLNLYLITKRPGFQGGGMSRTAGFSPTGSSFALLFAHRDTQTYQAEITGNVYREKMPMWGAPLIFPEGYTFPDPVDPDHEGITIIAEKLP